MASLAIREGVRSAGTYSTKDTREREPYFERAELRVPMAEEELHWWHTAAESVLGLRGTGFEGGGLTIWDAQKIHDTHMSLRKARHRSDMAKVAKIGPLIARLSGISQMLAALAFAPRRWSAVRSQAGAGRHEDTSSPDTLASLTRRAGRPGCLAGVCLVTRAARLAWAARERRLKHDPAEPTAFDLLTFLRDEAQGDGGQKILRPCLTEAEELLAGAVAEYDVLLQERIVGARRAAEAQLARLRAGEGP